MKNFDYGINFSGTNFRDSPHLYRIGRGEQGVLLVEPYKSEILQHWRFKTKDIASESAQKIYSLFLKYLDEGDFVGADMSRKFLMMGWTRSRRYANYSGGRKYDVNGKINRRLDDCNDSEKAQCAQIFRDWYERAKKEPRYVKMYEDWRAKEDVGLL